MIREEYAYDDIAEYLDSKIDLLITGLPNNEARSKYFHDIWFASGRDILILTFVDPDVVEYRIISQKACVGNKRIDLTMGIPSLLNHMAISKKNILIDLSALDHVLIMYLAKVMIQQVVPLSLFASYIRPLRYRGSIDDSAITLTDKILGVKAVPGFSKRERDNQILCAFIGFEGTRLKGVIESTHNVDKLIPVVAFPSSALHWYNITMWNSMELLNDYIDQTTLYKCFSESVFEAVHLLESVLENCEHVVLAPLGTRPHSMACAIYAARRSNIRIVYDYAIENIQRTEGIHSVSIYHLSSYLSV